MNLDNPDYHKQQDSDNMLGHVDGLPEQFEAAWQHAHTMPLPDYLPTIRQVVVAGMGGSAIGGDLLAAALSQRAKLSVTVIRGYELPCWAQGEETLVIASSFSGNTEETLSAYQHALEQNAHILGITTGGKLASSLKASGQTAWLFNTPIGHPRAAIGWSFGMLLGLAAQAGWATGLEVEFNSAITTLKAQREHYRLSTPTAQNPAKQLTEQVKNRLPVFIGGGIFEPIARRWKTQLNENSKVWAVFEPLPEMNHNAVVGIEFPKIPIERLIVVFINSTDYDHPRVSLRHRLTADLFAEQGITVEQFEPIGDNPLAQMMHAIQFGDYLSYYTAIAYGVDPAVIAPINKLKKALQNK